MRLALATCSNLPDWECDDAPFHAALRERGVAFEELPWDRSDVDWSAFDACLIRTTWDYQDRPAAFARWIDETSRFTRLINPAPVVRWNSHKGYLRELEEDGLRLAPTEWLMRGDSVNVRELLADRGWKRAFLKPLVGANSRETLRFTSQTAREAQSMLDRLLRNEDVVCQPYLESVETLGELSLLWFGGEYSHGVRKIPVAGDYRVQDDFGASDEPYEPDGELRAFGEAILAAVERRNPDDEPLAYARIDFLLDDDGCPCLNEVELIEPSLFFRHSQDAAGKLADVLVRRLT